jgi:hypothetical protein
VLVKVVLECRRRPRGCALAGWELAEAFDVDRVSGQDMLLGGQRRSLTAKAAALGAVSWVKGRRD